MPNDQLTDGGPCLTPELPRRVAGPPFGGAPGSALEATVNSLRLFLPHLYATGKQIPKTSPLKRATKNAFVATAYSCPTTERSSLWTVTAEKLGRYRKYVMARAQRLPVIKNDTSNATAHCFGVIAFMRLSPPNE